MSLAFDLHRDFISGKKSAQEIVQSSLLACRQKDGTIGALLSVLDERAMKKAKELDEKRAKKKPLGKLAGVPIGIKDNIHVRGVTTTCASRFLENFTAPFDASCVARIEENDGIIVAKCNMDEFAMGSFGNHSAFKETLNPIDNAYWPGGSSSGSAAAVAADMMPLTLGSDTGGSIRLPASFCGCVGFKPSYGLVSRYGLVAFGSSLDQIGPLAKSVKDVAQMMEVIGAPCAFDATCLDDPQESFLEMIERPLPSHLCVGVPFAFLNDLQPAYREQFERGLDILKKLGATFVDVDLSILRACVAVYYILANAEASTNLARFDGVRYGLRAKDAKTLDEVFLLSRKEGFGREVKRRILLGTFVLSSGFQDAYYRKAQKVRQLVCDRFSEIFSSCHAIAMPTAATPAVARDAKMTPLEIYLSDIYTIGANLGGLPAISVPIPVSKGAMPFGMQLLGKQRGDASLLQLARHFEMGAL